MMERLFGIENEIVWVSSILLILFNFIGFYFIIDLLDYDEIIAYGVNDHLKMYRSNPRDFAFLFLGTTACNLLYVFVFLMVKVLSSKEHPGSS
ncbi:hypothetical protein [Flavobacterium poyangense]|uniref:hypothetical protein n=1 Tax=Flavobacterium poyangense TaxID=2204302 RepID=UPI001423B90A|nr:hypothetical protein [Flavobacterium sp. JXAS1]